MNDLTTARLLHMERGPTHGVGVGVGVGVGSMVSQPALPSFALSIGADRYDNHPRRHEAATFDDLVDVLDNTRTMAKGLTYFCGALSDGHRCKESALPQAWITMDIDGATTADMAITEDILQQTASVRWHTHSHFAESPRDEDHRLRAVLKLSRSCSRDELKRVGEGLVKLMHAQAPSLKFDTSVFRIEQPNYVAAPFAYVKRGTLTAPGLDVEKLLAAVPPKPPGPPRTPRAPVADAKVREATYALSQLHPDALPLSYLGAGHRYDAIGILMFAVEDAGISFEEFDDWCSKGEAYHGTERVDKRWRSIQPGAVRAATLFGAADVVTPNWRQAYWDSLNAAERDELKGRTPADARHLNGNESTAPHDDAQSWDVPETPAPDIEAEMRQQESPAPVALKPWPDPRTGVMADLVSAVLSSSNVRRPIAALGAVVAAMCAGAHAIFHRSDGTRANAYSTIVMPTGGGKEALIRGASEIVRAAGGFIEGKPASGAALEMLLMPYRSLMLVINEAAAFLAAIGAQDAQQYLRDLSTVLLKAYSDSAYRYLPRSRAEDMKGMNAAAKAKYRDDRQKGIEHPSLSVLMLTQADTLSDALNVKNVAEGTLPRMLLVIDDAEIGKAGVIRQHEPKPFLMPTSASAAAAAIREALRRRLGDDPNVSFMAVSTVTVDRTDEAAERLRQIMDECDHLQAEGVMSAALMTRHAEKIARLSLSLAVWEDPAQPVVTLDMVDWSASFVAAADAALCHFVGEKVGLSERLQHVERAREIINRLLSRDLLPQKGRTKQVEWIERGFVPVAAVLRHCRLSAFDLDVALGHLMQLEEIEVGPAAQIAGKAMDDDREARAKLIARRG